jgi:hypothetical protein
VFHNPAALSLKQFLVKLVQNLRGPNQLDFSVIFATTTHPLRDSLIKK